MPPFDCSFATTAWFGDDVLWLAPADDAAFRALTHVVLAAFPERPPYEGAHGEEPIPHLTIGERRLGSTAEPTATDRAVRAHLPIRARVEGAVLLAGRRARATWRPVVELPLAGTG